MDQKFGKAYKLCSIKAIDALFVNKKAVKQYPFVMNYGLMELPTPKTFQVVISAPKRIFRKAHERNRIKRLMKEVLRKKKATLEEYLAEKGEQLGLFLVYTSKDELEYRLLEQKMEQLLSKLVNELKAQKNDQTN
ncbi:MAG: ribonuclease P protein component [Bacteroidota bacterium]